MRQIRQIANRMERNLSDTTDISETKFRRPKLGRGPNHHPSSLKALDPTLFFMSTNPSIFDMYEQAKKTSGKFLKLAPSEKRTLQFNVNKIAIVDSEFEGKPTGGKSIQFTVIDPHEPQLEKILTMGVKKAEGIMALLRAGKTLLDVQKIGAGKDSQFIAIPL